MLFLYFDVENDDKAGGAFAVDVFVEDSGVPATYSNGVLGDLTSRKYTSALVNWGATVIQAQTDVKSPDLKNVIQEVINNQGAVTDIAFLLAITGTGDISALAYETSPTQAFRLELFDGTLGNGPYNFITDIDIGTLPATATMTTDNTESTQFTADGQIECGNTFGFDLSNPPPIAIDDSETTDKDTPIAIDVLINDSDPESQPITITSITSAPSQGGSVSINNNGTPGDPSDDFVEYTPPSGFVGIETFQYQICDNGSPVKCDIATVTVTITQPIDYSPTAVDDYATTVQEVAITIDVQANDIDPSNTFLTTTLDSTDLADNGTLTIVNEDSITYTPDFGFTGTDIFKYVICNNHGCDTATVTVIVQCVDLKSDNGIQGFVFADSDLDGTREEI